MILIGVAVVSAKSGRNFVCEDIKMKKFVKLLWLVGMSILFASCGGEANQMENNGQMTEIEDWSGIQGDEYWFTKGFPYDEAGVERIVNAQQNLFASSNLYLSVPNKTRLYHYTYISPEDRNNQSYRDSFMETYDYFFPDHPLNDDDLYYMANDGSLLLVKEHLEEIMSNQNGGTMFSYDEAYNKKVDNWDSLVGMELGNPIGYGYGTVNKGRTVELFGKLQNEKMNRDFVTEMPCMISYDPSLFFPVVGDYSPKSKESFRLLDGELPIDEAVAFFENFMADLPFVKEANMDVKVTEVSVLGMGDGLYGYYFHTVGAYQDIPIEYLRSGVSCYDNRGNYVTSGGYAFMLESKDVDIIENFRKKQCMTDVVELTKCVPIEEAISIVSKSLTPHIKFSVERIELIYAQEYVPDEKGHINIKTYEMRVTPWWRFVLYNSNDDLTYLFYVDAETGSIRYYRTNTRLELQK